MRTLLACFLLVNGWNAWGFAPVQPRVRRLSTTHLQQTATTADVEDTNTKLPQLQSKLVKAGMMAYIASMCVALPLTLYPQKALRKLRLIPRARSEKLACKTGQLCSRWLLRLIPFCRISTYSEKHTQSPSIWVCNHTSMLDIFLLLAADKRLRGRGRRPIKIVYWKQLEDNPITRLLFRSSGFIPVQMADNGHGIDNEYDMSSFKQLLKDSKQAIAEGFDIGILPEGQLNPTPEKGLLPIYTGAYTLARLSKRPVRMMAMHGAHQLWHPLQGMKAAARQVKIRCYPQERYYQSADDFAKVFNSVVGHFGQYGEDLPTADELLSAQVLSAE